jgi:Tol biopolymer transport system component
LSGRIVCDICWGRRPSGGRCRGLYDGVGRDSDWTSCKKLSDAELTALSACFSRDGRSVLYSADVPREGGSVGETRTEVFKVDAAGGQAPKPLAAPPDGQAGTWANEPTVSPDGAQVVVVSDRGERYRYDLLVMNRDRSSPNPLGVTSVSK